MRHERIESWLWALGSGLGPHEYRAEGQVESRKPRARRREPNRYTPLI
jgi:hypothetical protein